MLIVDDIAKFRSTIFVLVLLIMLTYQIKKKFIFLLKNTILEIDFYSENIVVKKELQNFY
tara:strand:- start:136 stop:315 length:180 start_codon:yes stop_codon:yes gene_type:complete